MHPCTAKNSEKKICPHLENEDFFLKMSIFFLKTANYSPISEKNAHFEKKKTNFREKDRFFLGICCKCIHPNQ